MMLAMLMMATVQLAEFDSRELRTGTVRERCPCLRNYPPFPATILVYPELAHNTIHRPSP